MAKCVFIVQGEGKGHMSQALALKEYLADAGHSIEAVFIGCNYPGPIPEYFKEAFQKNLACFHSPFFLRTPNKKGIYVGRTILFNLARSLIYMSEVNRLRKAITNLDPDVVFNFYDVIGALALRKVDPGIRRVGIGHHFFLHLDGYRSRGGSVWHKWLLRLHTSQVMRSCDRVLALSYTEEKGNDRITVVPPLIRKAFREIRYNPGERYLVYLLNEGFIYNLISLSQKDPDFQADVFSGLEPGISLPSGLEFQTFSAELFKEKMSTAKGLICSAGFDTISEAAYHGIPLVAIPVKNHFEQLCNSYDVERSGIGQRADDVYPELLKQMKSPDQREFRSWVDRAGELIINSMNE
jgi:uncharacterized protein (TIGR00661 family)